MGANDPGDNDDEGAGRSADLDARAAERRDEESGNDGGDQPFAWTSAAGDAQRHGERQRNYGDGQAGECVGAKLRLVVTLPQGTNQLGSEGLRPKRLQGCCQTHST